MILFTLLATFWKENKHFQKTAPRTSCALTRLINIASRTCHWTNISKRFLFITPPITITTSKQGKISSGIRTGTRKDLCYLFPSGTVGIYLAFSFGTITTLAKTSYKIMITREYNLHSTYGYRHSYFLVFWTRRFPKFLTR
jgi:hypothetical protein